MTIIINSSGRGKNKSDSTTTLSAAVLSLRQKGARARTRALCLLVIIRFAAEALRAPLLGSITNELKSSVGLNGHSRGIPFSVPVGLRGFYSTRVIALRLCLLTQCEKTEVISRKPRDCRSNGESLWSSQHCFKQYVFNFVGFELEAGSKAK